MHQFWHLIQGGGDEPAAILDGRVWKDIDHLKQNVPQNDVLAFIPDTDAAQHGADDLVPKLIKQLDMGAGSFVVEPRYEKHEGGSVTTWYIRGVAGEVEVVGYVRFNEFGDVCKDSPIVATTERRVPELVPRYPALYGAQVATQAARIVGNHLIYLAARSQITIH